MRNTSSTSTPELPRMALVPRQRAALVEKRTTAVRAPWGGQRRRRALETRLPTQPRHAPELGRNYTAVVYVKDGANVANVKIDA